jgi:hypothetical protein
MEKKEEQKKITEEFKDLKDPLVRMVFTDQINGLKDLQ